MNIQNVVASTSLRKKLKLEELLQQLENSEYQPDTFPGLVYRIKDPSATFLIFQTGNVICVGSRSVQQAKKAVGKLISILKDNKISIPKNPKITIENVVVSDSLGTKINIDEIVFILENSEYSPDTFPGVIYRIDKPKASFLLFSSGKIICAGTRTIQQAKKAVEVLKKKLKKAGAI